jgi:hypothetical protein
MVLSLLLPCIIILSLHLLSTNHKCTQPYYFPLLLKPAAQKEMDWNSSTRISRLHVALVALVSLWVIVVFRDIIYVIIILYSWHLDICEHFWPYVWNNWSWVMCTMSTWFWHKNWVWKKLHESHVNHRNASLDRRVLSLVLFWVFAKIFYSNPSPLFLIYKI